MMFRKVINSFSMPSVGRTQQALDSYKSVFGFEVPSRYTLFDFKHPEAAKDWVTTSDSSIGGFSDCSLDIVDRSLEDDHDDSGAESDGMKGDVAVFKGSLSQKTAGNLRKSGYCAMRAHVPKRLLGLGGFQGLQLRVKTDGRLYTMNVQADSWYPDDLYQGYIRSPPGKWVTAELPFSNFLLTGHGYVREQQRILDPAKMRTLGICLADGKDGPFDIRIGWIRAVRDLEMQRPLQDEDF